eukprot:GHUV01048648.1.p1 GENE.GHUV01048648.1~~GHUV01048648.1.p1  ORF type:complete len:153 (+),score=34.87 GHUV01048648.1:1305-1763(+)
MCWSVQAPHIYGPSVTGQTIAATSGSTLFDRLFRSWGSKSPAANLNLAGIQQNYGVVPTEFGSDCDVYTGATCAGDQAYLADLATFLRNEAASSYNHNPGRLWFWWSWNANSGDTGGVVTGARPNAWYSIKWYKVRYLAENLGLCPWYKSGC